MERTESDLIVMGSGSAGLAAALSAAEAGLKVAVLEKTHVLGGTTAYSGAGTWIPANHHAARAGIPDSVQDALAYLRATAPPGWAATEEPLWEAFARNAPLALSLIERQTPLRFDLLDLPDTFPDAPGAKTSGRMLSPQPIRLSVAGAFAHRIRKSWYPQVLTYREMYELDPLRAGWKVRLMLAPRMLRRLLRGERGLGAALVAGLVRGCLDLGCDFHTDAPVTGLVTDEGRVTGVVARVAGRSVTFRASRGVVIASGGFEWDRDMLARHFPGPVDHLASPRANRGDGHRLAAGVGAAMAHMDQANINAAIPGRYEGQVQGIGWFHHANPGVILVNAQGRRFVNEETGNLGLALDQRGPDGLPLHMPVWLIGDREFLRRERVARWIARAAPDWLRRAPTVDALARHVGIDAGGLGDSIAAFNAEGPDVLGRTLRAPIARAPFVAVPFNRSFMSTKGGPRTDARAQVLRIDGTVIEGLYCAGVAMANPIGTKAIAAGTTIGPNLTWGYIAGRTAAGIQEKIPE